MPLFDPIEMEGLTYRDARTLPASEESATYGYLAQVLSEFPPEVLCDTASNPVENRTGRARRFDLSQVGLVGDALPVNFGAVVDGKVVDAFGLYAIELLVQTGTRWQINCRAYPGFVPSYDSPAIWGAKVSDFYEFLVDGDFAIEDGTGPGPSGRQVQIITIDTATYWIEDDTPGDTRVKAFHDAFNSRLSAPGPPDHARSRRPYDPPVVPYEPLPGPQPPGSDEWNLLTVGRSNGGGP